MGIYIPGIETPKGHNYVTITIWPSGATSYVLFDREGILRDFKDFKDIKAVPVSPHGRLIDVDKVLDELAHNLGLRSLDYLTPSERAIVSWFRDAPTVIPEEGGE